MSSLKLPMRSGVDSNANKIFVGKRKDNPVNMAMPQGGVDPGEDYKSAMKREL